VADAALRDAISHRARSTRARVVTAPPSCPVQDDVRLPGRLFAALATEPPGSRTALQEALNALGGAVGGGCGVGGAPGQPATGAAANATELEAMLLHHAASESPAVRLAAAQWANRLFPRNHVASRYVCLLAAGDTKPEVREAGLIGLGLSPTQLPPGASPSAHRTAAADLGLPLPGDVVELLVTRHPSLAQPGEAGRWVEQISSETVQRDFQAAGMSGLMRCTLAVTQLGCYAVQEG